MDAKPYKVPHPFKKLNEKLIDSVVKDIARGSTHKLAAQVNGITPRIMQIWVKQGDIDVEHEIDSLCARLVRSLAKVKQAEVVDCREKIKESDKGHKGCEWTLEHAYWREFGKDANIKALSDEIAELREETKGLRQDGNTEDSETE